MDLNPCSLYQEFGSISFHRKSIVLLMLLDLALLLLLRILTLFFRNQHKQRIDDLLKRKAIEKDVIQVEEIYPSEKATAPVQEQSSHANIKGLGPPAQDRLQPEKSESSSSSESSQRDEGESEPSKERHLIELGKLKLGEQEFLDTCCIHIGHRLICLTVVTMYYPFLYASLVALTQSVLRLVYYTCRMCGNDGKVVAALSGSELILNVLLLGIGIYGLSTRVLNALGTQCFDL